ncbi:MAG: hypothetical protein UT66_C0035G0003 [candidate division CPR2 bacterium GW2011_GWC1_39_9]|uniref:DUF218 domain-containing protein n=1 Tax=candidate division CPR2 bacterium GW2011_GWC2_39_10 TaxID=1618345 RepID=A0A0G0LRR0_UNCC2|nr:MAG: hypothetical protein UT18_C0016G0023 [candidate division CPR2 bacterium GW2011_GWC2_39_10]KKR33670.1 MAG: hypothetical protein UT66_C0035G0003 [candidate division CPR2 bacterium GW2011_GWC1_39_9]
MKKVKKFILLSLILLVPMSIAGLVLILGFWLSPQDQLQKADAIVVVSGGETKARTNEGIKLFKDGLSDYLIFSGAAEKGPISNASVMKSMAVEAGIDSSKIMIDETSENTYQNAKNVKTIIDNNNIKEFILVTSPYHQKRARVTFDNVFGSKYTIINHSAVDSTWRKSRWWQSPASIELTLQEAYRIIYIELTGKYE